MNFTKYSKWEGTDWDGISLEDLLERLAEFLLQSGFDGDYYYSDWADHDGDQTLERLRDAIVKALLEDGLLSDEGFEALTDQQGNLNAEMMAKLIDRLIERLMQEGYINLNESQT